MGEEKANRTSQGGMFHDNSGKQLPLAMQYDYTNFYFGAGDDAFAMLDPFDEWWKDSEPVRLLPVRPSHAGCAHHTSRCP